MKTLTLIIIVVCFLLTGFNIYADARSVSQTVTITLRVIQPLTLAVPAQDKNELLNLALDNKTLEKIANKVNRNINDELIITKQKANNDFSTVFITKIAQ